ncbi:MAG: pilus assembly FimT family protein [Planctomycetota bacterium]|jgi:prepilin-type N-terminal cleavage/methylation domain-containing protein
MRKSRAFTLIEVLVVMSLMGILFGLSIGLVAKAGRGNALVITSNALATQLASARSQAHGSDTAYVKLESNEDGDATVRSYRHRQVFHWACEDFVRASEEDVIKKDGNVEISTGVDSGEGFHAIFGGGTVSLGSPPWLQLVDGFNFKFRLNPSKESSRSNVSLFKKGEAIDISLVQADEGRYDLRCRIRLQPDREGQGAGQQELRTGFRGAAEVEEWKGPILGGRWQSISVSYDRNEFSIHVNGRPRGVRGDKRNAMKPDLDAPFTIGNGYMGGLDSLLLAGIFEDDDDRYEFPTGVVWVDPDGNTMSGKSMDIHFRNRALDARFHSKPIDVHFKLIDGARRTVQIKMSGEPDVKGVE